jgi:pimeloyl-ACP methyl ester carboxylesterase
MEQPLLWIHGLGESSRCFLAVAQRLNSFEHRLVDLPGYGKTPAADTYDLHEAADHIAGLLSQTGPAVVIGHSMGGVIGTFLCEHYSDLVLSFLNVDGNISLGDCGYSRPISEQSCQDFLAVGYHQLIQDLTDLGKQDLAHQGYAKSMSLASPVVVYNHATELVRLSRAEGLAHRMAQLRVPNLYIAGQPGGAAERSLELLNQAGVRVSTVEPSGHWPFIDQPESFADLVSRFLAGRGLTRSE